MSADARITYQVQYQEEGGKPDDWFIMTGRSHDERQYHSEAEEGFHELTSMDEAVEIAEALVAGRSHPHKRDAYYWRRIVAARVFTLVRLSQLSGVYGTPNTDVPRETSPGRIELPSSEEELMRRIFHKHSEED